MKFSVTLHQKWQTKEKCHLPTVTLRGRWPQSSLNKGRCWLTNPQTGHLTRPETLLLAWRASRSLTPATKEHITLFPLLCYSFFFFFTIRKPEWYRHGMRGSAGGSGGSGSKGTSPGCKKSTRPGVRICKYSHHSVSTQGIASKTPSGTEIREDVVFVHNLPTTSPTHFKSSPDYL